MNNNFQLDPQQWNTLRRLLDQALERPAGERALWLEGLDDVQYASLKPRLRALLAHAEAGDAGQVLDTLPKVETLQFAAGPARGGGAAAGTQIGPYRLLRQLGEGGMGEVWLAERVDILQKRAIALKLPRGGWRSAGLAERMAREREILATLDHPNIARLYDAGVAADGQPYLALEYVEGQPIDAYCKDQQLDLKARLQLFLQVARAVSHAHANLVVHRDLKPSNILVTQEGRVQLLDFGIAKLVQAEQGRETELTQLGGRAMTPDYASPEQIAGQLISTASDIYSLGVVLYELATGQRPYKLKHDSRAALEEAILSADAARASAVAANPKERRWLRGDLDTILTKALKKKPAERYGTVEALADDIERHLTSRPVLARPDGWSYRAFKFVARNRLAVGAAAAILVAVLTGAGLAVWQARAALAAQGRAEEVKEFIASLFRDADPLGIGGKAPSVADLLKQANEKIDSTFIDRPSLQVELLNIVGQSLLSMGDVAAAEPIVQRSLHIAREQLGADHHEALRAAVLIAQVHRQRGRTQEARLELERVLPRLRKEPAKSAAHLVQALTAQTLLELEEGRSESAVRAASEAVTHAIAHFGERNPETVNASIALAYAYLSARMPERALEAAEQAHRRAQEVHRSGIKHPRVVQAKAIYGRALASAGELALGIEELKQAQAAASELFGESSIPVGNHSQGLVSFQLDYGQIKEAIANAERGFLNLGQHLKRDSHSNARGLLALGGAWVMARRGDKALAPLTTARDALNTVGAGAHYAEILRALALAYDGRLNAARALIEPLVTLYRASGNESLSLSVYVLGVVERLAGHYDKALRLQEEALASVTPGPRATLLTARRLSEIGLNQLALGRVEAAEPTLQRALALLEQHEAQVTPIRTDALVGLGRVKLEQNRPAEALPWLQQADQFWRDFDGDNRWAGEAAFWLGRCYATLGREAAARAAYARAAKVLARSSIAADAELVQVARNK
jgi:serine/threonine-protein kinase